MSVQLPQSSNVICKKHICTVCNQEYKSRQSLWNHINKFHKPNNQIPTANVPQKLNEIHTTPHKSDDINCKFCNKVLSRDDSLKRHMKTCKKKETFENENNKLENAITKINQLEKELSALKSTTSKPKTINNNSGTINNANVINNINIVAPGNENNDLSIEEIKFLRSR